MESQIPKRITLSFLDATNKRIEARMIESIKQSGLKQAKQYNLKSCPKDNGAAMLFAGSGLYDYEIICYTCGYRVKRNSLKSTISRWNVATAKAKKEV